MDDDFIFFDVKGDSTLKNLNTVIEPLIKYNHNNENEYEQNFIDINEPSINKKKKKKKKKNSKNRENEQTFKNPTKERPIIIDDDVYIEIESDNNENSSSDNILSNNAFDILNKAQINNYMDDDIIKDYLENCKNDETESDNSENQNDLLIEKNRKPSDDEDISFLNSEFAKNIIKSDVGVETEPVEMEMDLIKLLENKLPSDDSSSFTSENSDNEYNIFNVEKNENSVKDNSNEIRRTKKNSKSKKKNKRKSNKKARKTNTEFENKDIPVIDLEEAIIELDKDQDLENTQDIFNNSNIKMTNTSIKEKEIKNKKDPKLKPTPTPIEVIEIDDNNNTDSIDIITLLENTNSNDDDVVVLSDNEDISIIDNSTTNHDAIIINEEEDIINISEEDDSDGDDFDYNDNEDDEDDNDYNEDDENTDSFEDEDDENENDEINSEHDGLFSYKRSQEKILVNDENELYYFENNFEGGQSSWDSNYTNITEKLKNSKFKAILNSDTEKLLRLQKKKLQKKELAQKKEYLLKKKENLQKENKRIQKVLKTKKGNKLNCSPEVFKYLKHVNTTIREFVTNGFESIPLGNLPSELRKSVGMIAMEYNVKLKTRGSGKRKITNLIRTSRSRIPENWNTIVETVFSKTEAQRHSNMDVRKRNLDMAKRRGKYHNTNRGKSSKNKPELGSKVGQDANPISNSNKGFKLLQSMGWTPGESLGADNTNGIINPIEVVVRDQSGLGASYFDQGYNQSLSGQNLDETDDEYERDILYNNRSSMFSSKNKRDKARRKKKRFSDDSFGLGRKASKNSINSKRNSSIGETGGLENAPYSFVNFHKGKSLFSE